MSTLQTPKGNTKPGECSDRVAIDMGAENNGMYVCMFLS